MKEFLSPSALARRLGVAELTVRRWLSAGLVPQPTIRVGRTRGYSEATVSRIEAAWKRRQVQDSCASAVAPVAGREADGQEPCELVN